MVVRVLFLICCFFFSVSKTWAVSQPSVIELPFTLKNGAVLVPLQIKGMGPFTFAIATGAARSTLSWEAKTKLGYQTLFYIEPSTQKQVTYVQASGMQIGEWKLDTLSMKLGELGAYSKELETPLHGMLGHDFLKKQSFQIDYRNKVVRFFLKGEGVTNLKSNQTSLKTIAPIEITNEEPVPVIKTILVNGSKLKAMVDTWQNVQLSLSPAALKELKIDPPPEKTGPQIKVVESLQVGELKQEKVKAACYSKGTGLDHGLGRYGAILGADFLSNYVVTFDYFNKQIIFQ